MIPCFSLLDPHPLLRRHPQSQLHFVQVLKAAILALETLKGRNEPVIEVKSRSDYITQSVRRLSDWTQNGWLSADGRPIANRDLWKRVWSLLQTMDTEVCSGPCSLLGPSALRPCLHAHPML